MKRLLVESLIVAVTVYLLYGPQAVLASSLLMVMFLPVVLLAGWLVGIYKRNRRKK